MVDNNTIIQNKKLLVVITGPTAVGKSSIAIDLASHYNSVIISADSRQFFKKLDIVTAKPNKYQLSQVKHYFIDNLEIEDYYNVSMFEEQVLDLLKNLFQNLDIVFMVGGSGLYIDAVCNGIDFFPDIPDKTRQYVNNIYKTQGLLKISDMLKELDPVYYSQVDLKNPKRIIRALEVILTTKKTYSEQRINTQKIRDFDILKIALQLDRNELNSRISQRVDQMIKDGLLKEAESMYKYKNLNALNTVGYKEIFDFLDGVLNYDEAIEKIKTNTRRYAKRQMTWLKKDSTYNWFSPNQYEEILELINKNR